MKRLALLLLVACSGSPGPGGTGGGGAGGAGGGRGLEPGDACTGDWACWARDAGALLACEPRQPDSVTCGIVGSGCRTFKLYPCRGFGGAGCTSSGAITHCEFVGALRGDPCPELQLGKGFCSDGGIMVCRDAGWVESSCPNCREQSGQILCN